MARRLGRQNIFIFSTQNLWKKSTDKNTELLPFWSRKSLDNDFFDSERKDAQLVTGGLLLCWLTDKSSAVNRYSAAATARP